jgi:hypothetical protein
MIIKDIPEFNGLYKATNNGQVFSFTKKLNGKPMKLWVRKDGYVQVQIKIKQKVYNRLVHVLVDRAFNGPIENGYEINHKDGNKQNNSIDNLERVTRKENIKHAIKNNLWNPCWGENHRSAKLKKEDVIKIKKLASEAKTNNRYKHGFLKQISELFNVHVTTIKKIANNETWKRL